MDLIPLLKEFSLTSQEATIYLTMYENSELTGYEITKKTGISRSNVYTCLNNIVKKGAASLIEEKSNKYTAVDITEFCKGKIEQLEKVKFALENKMPEKAESAGRYITISGDQNIINKMTDILSKTQKRIYISMSKEYIGLVSKQIEALIDKNIKVVIVTDEVINFSSVSIYYSKNKQNQIRLIADSSIVLTGELSDSLNTRVIPGNDSNSSCLYSDNLNLVKLFKESLQNEIQLIKLNMEL